MSLINRIAKKIRRRFRKTGTFYQNVSARMNEAETLIRNNWNMNFNSPEPEYAGMYRAIDRATAKREANAKIPKQDRPMSRQVERREQILFLKSIRQRQTAKFTKRRR